MSDYLQGIVDQLKPPNEIKDRVVLFHYLKGLSNNPYQLRRTKVHLPENSNLSKIAKEMIGNQSNMEDSAPSKLGRKMAASKARKEQLESKALEIHRIAMQEYIRYLDRDNTFLSLIIKEFIDCENRDALPEAAYSGDLSIILNHEDESECILQKITEDNNFQIQWQINQVAMEILTQNTSDSFEGNAFLHEIYNKINGARKIDNKWKYIFQYARAELFGKLCKEKVSVKEKKQLWELVSSVQGILVFLSSAGTFHSNLSCSFIIVENKELQSDETELAVMIVSPSITNENLHKLKMEFNDIAEIMFERISDKSRVGSDFESRDILSKCFPVDEIGEKCYELIGRSIYYSSLANIDEAKWAMLLMHNLMNRKHEGQLLDFFIVCGELSQFKDLPQVKFRDLNPKSRDDLK